MGQSTPRADHFGAPWLGLSTHKRPGVAVHTKACHACRGLICLGVILLLPLLLGT